MTRGVRPDPGITEVNHHLVNLKGGPLIARLREGRGQDLGQMKGNTDLKSYTSAALRVMIPSVERRIIVTTGDVHTLIIEAAMVAVTFIIITTGMAGVTLLEATVKTTEDVAVSTITITTTITTTVAVTTLTVTTTTRITIKTSEITMTERKGTTGRKVPATTLIGNPAVQKGNTAQSLEAEVGRIRREDLDLSLGIEEVAGLDLGHQIKEVRM